MGSFSIWHWLVVLLIIVLVFGTKKLRNIGSDLGGAVRDFKSGMRDEKSDASAAAAVNTTASTPAAPQQIGQPTAQTIEGEVVNKTKS